MGDSHLSAVELVGATSGQHYPLFNDFDEFYPDDVAAPDRSGLSTLMACDPDWGWVQDNQEVVVSAALHLLESLTADGEYGIGEWVACEFRVASTRFVLATRKKQQSAFGAVALFETVPADRPTRSGEPKLAVGAGLRTSHSWNGIVAANDRGVIRVSRDEAEGAAWLVRWNGKSQSALSADVDRWERYAATLRGQNEGQAQ